MSITFAEVQPALDAKQPIIAAGTSGQYFRGDKTWQTLDKSAVGLSNVSNVSSAELPISIAAQAALDGKQPATVIQVAVPATGQTVTIAAATNVLVVNPAGALLALTLDFPVASNGQSLTIVFSQAITTITTSGAPLLVALTAATLGLTKTYTYSTTLSKWC